METIIEQIRNMNAQTAIDLIIAIGIIALFDIILSPIFSYVILKIFNFKKSRKEIVENTLYHPLKVIFSILGIYIAIVFLKSTFNFSEDFMNMITKIFKIIVIVMTAHSLANSITKKSFVVKTIKDKSDKDINDNTTKIIVRVIKIIIYIIAAFMVFAEIGYDLSGLITGLGLGSVVLTLAAQNTIKDLIGGLLIVMDKPFSAGDYIKYSDYQGTVEDMSFRSVRIRTLDDTIVLVPNSEITAGAVENVTRQKKKRFYLELELVTETNLDKINRLEENLRNILIKNEKVLNDTINVHFTDISANGLKMTIICYFNTTNYMEFLDLKEEVNKNIIEAINRENISIAYETKTIEVKR